MKRGKIPQAKLLLLVISLALVSFNFVYAYPKMQYLSINETEQQRLNNTIYSINETYYDGVRLIQLWGMERWYQDGWYTTGRVIMIDKGGLDTDERFKYVLEHELTHNKCTKKVWDFTHDSKCFIEGLI